eukprot:3137797-Rhodomonas_salina.1
MIAKTKSTTARTRIQPLLSRYLRPLAAQQRTPRTGYPAQERRSRSERGVRSREEGNAREDRGEARGREGREGMED